MINTVSLKQINYVFFVQASEKPDNTTSFAQVLLRNKEKIR